MEALQEGVIDMKFSKSEDQLADIFTKGLPEEKINQLRLKFGGKLVSNLGGVVDN